MTERRLRYSERLAIAETGALVQLNFEQVPEPFRRALAYVVHQGTEDSDVGRSFSRSLHSALVEHFGRPGDSFDTQILELDVPEFLDLVEILAEETTRTHEYSVPYFNAGRPRYSKYTTAAVPDFRKRFNDLADRHRLGYRLIGDSLEAALKAAGVQGATLGQLAKSFKGSPLAVPQLRGTPDLLKDLLERSAALRNVHGDAHGRAPGEYPNVPQELVDLAVHLTGAFIVYLERASR